MSLPHKYQRVIPRDFFNEARLLNCLGKFEIAVGNGDFQIQGLEVRTRFDDSTDSHFVISQDPSSAALYCENYHAWIEFKDRIEPIELSIPYNAREKFPLIARYQGEDYFALDENGKATKFGEVE